MKKKIIGGLILFISFVILIGIVSTETGVKEALIAIGTGLLLAALMIIGIVLLSGIGDTTTKKKKGKK
jgi:hypothetical protein